MSPNEAQTRAKKIGLREFLGSRTAVPDVFRSVVKLSEESGCANCFRFVNDGRVHRWTDGRANPPKSCRLQGVFIETRVCQQCWVPRPQRHAHIRCARSSQRKNPEGKQGTGQFSFSSGHENNVDIVMTARRLSAVQAQETHIHTHARTHAHKTYFRGLPASAAKEKRETRLVGTLQAGSGSAGWLYSWAHPTLHIVSVSAGGALLSGAVRTAGGGTLRRLRAWQALYSRVTQRVHSTQIYA